MTLDQLELEAIRQIRQKVSDTTDKSNNDEIAGFVKGIVALEKELFSFAIEDEKNQKESDYFQGEKDERQRVLDILHNNYEVRNPEQNQFMDRLCLEVIKGEKHE